MYVLLKHNQKGELVAEIHTRHAVVDIDEGDRNVEELREMLTGVAKEFGIEFRELTQNSHVVTVPR